MMRNFSTAFNTILPSEPASVTMYPEALRDRIDVLSPKLHAKLATGVYKAGFNPSQAAYEENLVIVFAMLNRLEIMLHESNGSYLLGDQLTELDIIMYACLIRFDVVYHQHMKCNLGMIRHDYPLLHAYLQNLYWNVPGFKETTKFDHIKENVGTNSVLRLRALTRCSTPQLIVKSIPPRSFLWVRCVESVHEPILIQEGPYPDILPIDEFKAAVKPGGIFMPRVVSQEIDFP